MVKNFGPFSDCFRAKEIDNSCRQAGEESIESSVGARKEGKALENLREKWDRLRREQATALDHGVRIGEVKTEAGAIAASMQELKARWRKRTGGSTQVARSAPRTTHLGRNRHQRSH